MNPINMRYGPAKGKTPPAQSTTSTLEELMKRPKPKTAKKGPFGAYDRGGRKLRKARPVMGM